MTVEDTFTNTVDGAAGHARQFASDAYDDRPSASDIPADIPAHTCWRNGGVECRCCELEEQAEEAGGHLTCASTHHRREVHAAPGTDRCAECLSDAQTEMDAQR